MLPFFRLTPTFRILFFRQESEESEVFFFDKTFYRYERKNTRIGCPLGFERHRQIGFNRSAESRIV